MDVPNIYQNFKIIKILHLDYYLDFYYLWAYRQRLIDIALTHHPLVLRFDLYVTWFYNWLIYLIGFESVNAHNIINGDRQGLSPFLINRL